jgi:hypothetical protein
LSPISWRQSGKGQGEWRVRVRQFQARRVKHPLQIVLADLDVAKGHTQTLVTEEFLKGRQAHTGPQQFCG